MVQTNRIAQNRLVPPRLPWLLLVAVLALVIGLAGLEHFSQPAQPRAPSYSMAVGADGSIEVNVPTDVGMPTPPNCKDYGLDQECKWIMKWAKRPGTDHYDFVEVKLQAGDDWIMSRVQMAEVELVEVEEVAGINMAGHQTGWIAHVQVAQRFVGNGIGRLTWQAGDAALKIWAGANGTDSVVRIVNDIAGWGSSLMAEVPPGAFLYAEDPVWIYVITRG